MAGSLSCLQSGIEGESKEDFRLDACLSRAHYVIGQLHIPQTLQYWVRRAVAKNSLQLHCPLSYQPPIPFTARDLSLAHGLLGQPVNLFINISRDMASEQPVPPPVGDVTTADTAPPAPRVIDENTDMSTLTDQEIMKLVEGMGQEDVTNKVQSHLTCTLGDQAADMAATYQRPCPSSGHPRRIPERLGAGLEETGLASGARLGPSLASKRGWRLFLPM